MMETVQAIHEEENDYLFPCFQRADLAFTHGAGAWLEGVDGARYLDFATGIAVTGLGHSHPALVAELIRQGRNCGTCRMR